ncbi:MAG: acyltransferase [Chromatiaceae bacterium]
MRFSALDSWRGIAALAVALLHSPFQSHFQALQVVQNSYLLVDFFFVLSGFVITHAYLQRLRKPGGFGSFVIRRFGRLWPLHIFVLGAFLVLELVKLLLVDGAQLAAKSPPFTGGTSLESLFSSIFLAQSLGLHDAVTWNAPSWSISVEFYTYLLFALVVLTLGRYMLSAAVILILGSLSIIIGLAHGFMGVSLDYGFFRCIAGFFMGYLTYRAYRTAGASISAGSETAALAIMLLFLLYAGRGVPTVLAPFVFSLIVFVFAAEGGTISRLLRRQPFRALGEWSYSIYMVHAFFVVVIMRAAQVIATLTGSPLLAHSVAAGGEPQKTLVYWGNAYLTDAMTAVYLALTILIASLTYRFVEQPGRSWFNRVAQRHESRRAANLNGLAPKAAAVAAEGHRATDPAQVPRRSPFMVRDETV